MSGWVKLDEGFFMHPKALAAGRDGRDVFIAALCWSNQQRTDGLIPPHALPLIASLAGVTDVEQAASRLCEVGLWDYPDEDGPPGFQVHDFLTYQQSREDREAWLAKERDRKQAARDALRSQQVPEPVRADMPRIPRNVRSRDVDVSVDENNNDAAPVDKRFSRLLSTVAWSSARTTPGVRSQSGYQRAIVEGADESGLADQLRALLRQHPGAELDWLVDEHLGRAHPRAPYVPPDPKEVMRAHRGGAA